MKIIIRETYEREIEVAEGSSVWDACEYYGTNENLTQRFCHIKGGSNARKLIVGESTRKCYRHIDCSKKEKAI